VNGLVAGEFAIVLDPSVVKTIKDATPALRLANLTSRFDDNHVYYNAALLTTDGINNPDADLLKIVVEHFPGQTGTGLSLAKALLNEGQIKSNVPEGSIKELSTRNSQDIRPPLALRIVQRQGGVTCVNASRGYAHITVLTITGRTLFSRKNIAPGTASAIPVAGLSRGTYLIRVSQPSLGQEKKQMVFLP
jgi:hypothetical protein